MGMEAYAEYIRPELLVLVAVLYVVGNSLKAGQLVPDRLIPITLGLVSIALALLWLVSSTLPTNRQEWAKTFFTALVQGSLLAGQAVYLHQLGHQRRKGEKEKRQPPSRA